MINNIIFDWSGVIKDSVLEHLLVTNRIFKKLGIKEITLQKLQENWRQPYMLFYNKYLPSLNIDQFKTLYKEAILESPKAKEYLGINDLIKKFKKNGKKLVVLSSDSPETILPEMKIFDLEDVFDDMIMDVHDKGKVIHDLIERNNFNKENTVFIGDSNHEIEVGKKAGIKTIAVTWGFNSEERLKAENPDFIVHNLKELEKVIL